MTLTWPRYLDCFLPANGQFYDVENQATLKQTEHFRCNYIEWDPSGRYACTAVSQPVTGSHWKAQMDNGFQLFSFQARAFGVYVYFSLVH